MNTMKKVIIPLLLLALLLSGCAGESGGSSLEESEGSSSGPASSSATSVVSAPDSGSDSSNDESSGAEQSSSAGEPAVSSSQPPQAQPGVRLSVAVITSGSDVEDGLFHEEIYDGVLDFLESNPRSSVRAIEEPTGNSYNAVQAAADAAAHYDVIIASGFQFAGISKVAAEYPEKYFILIDAVPNPIDDQSVFPNVYSVMFAEQESGFCAGMSAALETVTGKVAVVNGVAYPSNMNYQYGFEAGVRYVNRVYNRSVEIVAIPEYAGITSDGNDIGGNYVGSFSDENRAKIISDFLIDEDCDVLFASAGHSGLGVFSAAKGRAHVLVIGCDTDQYDFGSFGSRNIVLTSAVKNARDAAHDVLKRIAEGSFAGENVVLDAKTGSTGFVTASGRQQMQPENIALVRAAYDLIKSGALVPPSVTNGYTADNFPGLPGFRRPE